MAKKRKTASAVAKRLAKKAQNSTLGSLLKQAYAEGKKVAAKKPAKKRAAKKKAARKKRGKKKITRMKGHLKGKIRKYSDGKYRRWSGKRLTVVSAATAKKARKKKSKG